MTDTEQDVVDRANTIYAHLGMLVRSLEGLNLQLDHLQIAIESLNRYTFSELHGCLGNSREAIYQLRLAGVEARAIAARVSGN